MDGMGEATAALAAIAGRDPSFDLEAFLSEAADIYLRVDRARQEGRPDAVKAVVADSARAALRLDSAPIGPPDPPTLSEPQVTKASTGSVDTIEVRFTATRHGQRSVEDWTFQRPATATTQPTGTAECPQCGARGSRDAEGRCRYCGSTDTPAGWRVTRATALEAHTVGGQVATGAELAGALAAFMTAAAAAGPTGPGGGPYAGPAPRRARPGGCGCTTVFWLVVALGAAAAGVAVWAWLQPSSPVHRPVAKIIPGVRRAHLSGQLNLTGGATYSSPFTVWWPKSGRCDQLTRKGTVLTVVGAAAAAGTAQVEFRAAGATFGAVPLTKGAVTVVPSFDTPAGLHQTWSDAAAGATVRFVMNGDGSGEATFAHLSAALTTPGASTAPLAGTLRWTCKDE